MLKVIPESHGTFALKPKDESSLTSEEETLCKLVDMNVHIESLYVEAVSKLRKIAEDIEAKAITAGEGLKKAQSVDRDLELKKREVRKPQFSVKPVDRDWHEIDSNSHDKAYDIDIHAEDVAIPEDKRNLEVEIERTLAVIRKVVDPDTNPSKNARRKSSSPATHQIRKKRSHYIQELAGISHVGLEHDDPSQIPLARQALNTFRDEFVTNESGPVKNRYLKRLGVPCLLVSVLSFVVYIVAREYGSPQESGVRGVWQIIGQFIYPFQNFFLLFAGAGVGTWLSFTLRKPALTFLDLVALEEDHLDPGIRVAFVSALVFVVGLLFWTGALKVGIGNIEGGVIKADAAYALLIGLLLGIAERTMSSAIFKRATDFAGAIGGK